MAEGGCLEKEDQLRMEKRWRMSEVIWEETEVGCPFVCCEFVLLPLVNKDSALTYGRAEYNKAGNLSRDRGGKKVESRDTM